MFVCVCFVCACAARRVQFVPELKIKQYKTTNNKLRKTKIKRDAKSLGFSETTRRGSLLAASRGRLESDDEAVSTNVKSFHFEGRGEVSTRSVPPSLLLQFLSFSPQGPIVPVGGEGGEAR